MSNIGKALVSKCRHGMGQPGNATDEDHVSNQQCNAGVALVSNSMRSMDLVRNAMRSMALVSNAMRSMALVRNAILGRPL